jgi:hypothetical protein
MLRRIGGTYAKLAILAGARWSAAHPRWRWSRSCPSGRPSQWRATGSSAVLAAGLRRPAAARVRAADRRGEAEPTAGTTDAPT